MRFDPGSPEAAWGPMIDWMRGQGLNEDAVYSLDVDERTLDCVVTEYELDDRGRPFIPEGSMQPARHERVIRLTSLPPLRRVDRH